MSNGTGFGLTCRMQTLRELHERHMQARGRIIAAGTRFQAGNIVDKPETVLEEVAVEESVEAPETPPIVVEGHKMIGGSPTLPYLAALVCRAYGLRAKDLRSDKRWTELIVPRHHFCWLARRQTPYSLGAIGRHLGGRDHSTVFYAIKKHAERVKAGDPRVREVGL